MENVVSFAELKEKKAKTAEDSQLTAFFMNEILPHLSSEDREKLREAIIAEDLEAWKNVTMPILMRNTIREINLQGSGGHV